MVIEAPREIEPALIARVSIEIREHLVHAAKLGIEHLLSLFGSKFGKNSFGPGGELYFQFQRGAVPGKTVSIAKSRVSLVQRIPGRPETIQIEES